jgi:hypothetical protein
MAFLSPETFDLTHGHAANAKLGETVLDLLQLEWLDDCFDFLHSKPPLKCLAAHISKDVPKGRFA